MEKHTRGERDHAREAVLSVVSAVAGSMAEHQKRLEGDQDHGSRFYLPAVVTTSPLFACRLDDDGQVRIDRVARHTVIVRPEFDPDLEGPVMVLTLEALDEHVSRVRKYFDDAWTASTLED
jgi:hypothetical protein